MSSQLGVQCPSKFVYFGLKTPIALACQCLLEISGKPYEGKSVAMDEWAELKPKTPTGLLPYADMPDGTVMAESGAIGRVIAASAGLLGEGKDFMVSEQLAGMTADLIKKVFAICPTMFTVESFDDAKKAAYAEQRAGILEYLDKYKPMLLPAGDRFTESGLTYGEVDLFAKLNCCVTGCFPEIMEGPLAAFCKRMEEVPGIKKVLAGETQFGSLPAYLIPMP